MPVAGEAVTIGLAVRAKLLVVSGGPGVGKTTLVVTRGRKLVVLVAQPKAGAIAVKGQRELRRWSKLKEWLKVSSPARPGAQQGLGLGRRRMEP